MYYGRSLYYLEFTTAQQCFYIPQKLKTINVCLVNHTMYVVCHDTIQETSWTRDLKLKS
uniref:Uncharacterized protein n=1 Tax=Anguilla anguilla TaxID=7936 RepID=A0A0E9PRG3_ANGAN